MLTLTLCFCQGWGENLFINKNHWSFLGFSCNALLLTLPPGAVDKGIARREKTFQFLFNPLLPQKIYTQKLGAVEGRAGSCCNPSLFYRKPAQMREDFGRILLGVSGSAA